MDRRRFLTAGAAAAGAALWSRLIPGSAAELDEALFRTDGDAVDEAFWRSIRAFYTPPDDYIDLDQANTSATASPVFDAFVARARGLSHAPAERFNRMWVDDVDKVSRPALADFLGTQANRLAFVGSTTVGLNTVLHGFPFDRGDEILVTDHEYPDMIETILQLGRRFGVTMRIANVPRPDEEGAVLAQRVAESIGDRTKLLLISHVSAWSGEILPVVEVTKAARSRGVAVAVDAAQSVGIVRVDFDTIGCDFLAASLHKGLGGPLGCGVLLMRQEHVGRVWPLHPPSWDTDDHPMDLYEWSGTFDMSSRAAAADALEFQKKLGFERKLARLRYLGNYWMNELADVPGVRLLTPRQPERFLGVGAFALDGVSSALLARHLRGTHGLLVQDKSGRHSPYDNAVRVSPAAYTTPAELDRFATAVRAVARDGIQAAGPRSSADA